MKKAAIGHIDCHICGFDAEVKISDKSGFAYTFCPDCNAQSFCRNKHQHDKLIAKMRPVTVAETAPPPVTVTENKGQLFVGGEKVADVTNLKVEKKAGFSLGAL